MLTPKNIFAKDEMRLLKSFRQLETADKNTVIAFAAFLASGQNPQQEVTIESKKSHTPLGIPRPEDETVIAAIKRLSKNYPMLDKGEMLDDTSTLMSGHLLQGRPANEVIDKLEIMFKTYYTTYQDDLNTPS